ncbi:MAG: SRPBCC family protein [Nitrospiraceae bacterium]
MAATTSPSDTTLRLTRTFAAPREKVFQAWTDAEALKRWFAPADDFSTPLVEVDLRVGGKYRIQMKAPDGAVHTVAGVYREITPPEKLVFTWDWEGDKSCGGLALDQNTEVTVEFLDRGRETEIVLTHVYFTSAEQRDKHSHGWTGCLDRLQKLF